MAARVRSSLAVGVLLAVASAVAFGVTTPLIARVAGGAGVLTTASLLYAGAAVASALRRMVTPRSGSPLGRAAVARLLLMGLFGAGLAPTLLVWGINRAGATASSLVLTCEAVFTVLLARVFYREPIGLRVGLAVAVMAVGGFLLAVEGLHLDSPRFVGLLAVAAATLAWALDNTLSRSVAEHDPSELVLVKGAIGVALTGSLALSFERVQPSTPQFFGLLACGATGYGLSLQLYLLAQRRVGAARTGSVFAIGPFVGAALAWLLGDRELGMATCVGAVAFGLGVYLHLTERHSHAHVHPPTEHEHAHRHDDGHHDHVHEPPVKGEHSHVHRHPSLVHEHEHAPDVHHEHVHS
jgi:drug/metabolite transporter (DMT)-like permease